MALRSLSLILVLMLPASSLLGQEDAQPAAPAERVFVSGGVEKRQDAGEWKTISHVWGLEQRGEKFRLLHRTSEHPPGELYEAFVGTGRVESMAAEGRRLLLVYAGRSVQSVEFIRVAPAQPPNFHATRLPMLPEGRGRCLIAAGAGGVFAMLFSPTASEEETGDAAVSVTLLRWAGLAWQPIETPEELDPSQVLSLLSPTETDAGPILISGIGTHAVEVHRHGAGGWTSETYELAARPGNLAFAVVGHSGISNIVAARRDPYDGGVVETLWLRGGSVTPLARTGLRGIVEPWWLGVTESGLLLVTSETQEGLLAATVSFPSATSDPEGTSWVPLRVVERPFEIDVITTTIMMAMVVGILVLMMSGRRVSDPRATRFPAGLRPAGVTRLAAALFDFVPGLATAMIYFQITDPSQVFERLTRPEEPTEVLPLLMAIAVHVGHTMVGELLTGRTVGKALLGCRVVRLDGGRASVWQVLLRNFFKAVEMIAPPLIVFALFSPTGQRLGDVLSRTVVVMPAPPEKPPSQPESRADDEEL